MEFSITTIKPTLIAITGGIGAVIAFMLGGWDVPLQTLIIVMCADYITGLLVAGVFKKSPKSLKGSLESKAGFKGLCKKGVILMIVLVATQLDKASGTQDMIRNATVVGYTVNDLVSIVENIGLMGIPIPESLRKAIDILKTKSETTARE